MGRIRYLPGFCRAMHEKAAAGKTDANTQRSGQEANSNWPFLMGVEIIVARVTNQIGLFVDFVVWSPIVA
jgi:hypothetical protein